MTYPYVIYNPVDQRTPDGQYPELLKQILNDGVWMDSQMDEPVKSIFGVTLDFPIANGAPVITQRDIVTKGKNGRSVFTQALGEIIGFINGAHTQAELESFGCFYWKDWVSEAKCHKRDLETGDLGPGSYGSAWTHFPTAEGIPFNQIDAIIAQIREKPHLKTHELTPWIPQYIWRATGYKQKVVVVPCHGWVHVVINTRTGEMTLIHRHRSCDVVVGLPCNMVSYTAVGLILAMLTGYTLTRVIFQITDAHIYESQIAAAESLVGQPNQVLPTIMLTASGLNKTSIYDFRLEDVTVVDYYPSSGRVVLPRPV